jgi:hypothetical protein
MLRGVIASVLLAGVSVPATAMTYVAQVKGVVTSQIDTGLTAPGSTSPIKVGDTITATFTYMEIETVGEALAARFGKIGPKKVTYQLGGYTWTSAGDFGTGLEPVSFEAGIDPVSNYYSTMDDAPGAGDLHVDGYAFQIGEFGYDLYTGPGFDGQFDANTLAVWVNGRQIVVPTASMPSFVQSDNAVAPVPEPMTWALLIAGFGMAGTALRNRKPARATA